jgi:hypothetical protein
MISTVIYNITPANEKQKIKYRSFKNMGVIALNEDMSKVNIQVQSNTRVSLKQKEFSLYFHIKDHSSNLPSINNDHIVQYICQ